MLKRYLGALAVGAAVFLGLTACSGSPPKRVGEEVAPLWTAPIASYTTPIVANGLVYVAGFTAGNTAAEYKTYALDAATGKEVWAKPSSATRMLGVAGPRLFTLDYEKKVHAADAKTGVEDTAFDVSEMTDDFVSRDNDVYVVTALKKFVASEKSQVAAIDVVSGKKRWSVPFPRISPDPAASIVGANGKIILLKTSAWSGTTSKTSFTAFDRLNGTQLWTMERPTTVELSRIEEDAVFLLVSDTKTVPEGNGGNKTFACQTLVAVDAMTGKERWKLTPGGRVFTVSDGVVVTWMSGNDTEGKQLSYYQGLDPATGKEIWKTEMDLKVFSAKTFFPINGLIWSAYSESVTDWRKQFDGDRTGNKVEGGFPLPVHASSVCGIDHKGQKIVRQSKVFPATQISDLAESGGVLFVSTKSEMKEGESGIRAYKAVK